MKKNCEWQDMLVFQQTNKKNMDIQYRPRLKK